MIKYILGKSLSIAINIASSHFENILEYSTLFQDYEKRRRFISSILFVSTKLISMWFKENLKNLK